MLGEGFSPLPIFLAVDGEGHQIDWRVLLGELGGHDFLAIGKELDVAQTKLLGVAFAFSNKEYIFPNP